MMGYSQVKELGEIETPILLTNTDQATGVVSDYQILSLQENICFLNGTIPFVIDTLGLTINSEIDVELQLVRQ